MTKTPTLATSAKETAASPRPTPLAAVHKHCRDCSGFSFKSLLWCTCTDCNLWIFRFGRRPESMPRELVTPALFIDPYANEDDLPNGIEAAATYLAERQAGNGALGLTGNHSPGSDMVTTVLSSTLGCPISTRQAAGGQDE